MTVKYEELLEWVAAANDREDNEKHGLSRFKSSSELTDDEKNDLDYRITEEMDGLFDDLGTLFFWEIFVYGENGIHWTYLASCDNYGDNDRSWHTVRSTISRMRSKLKDHDFTIKIVAKGTYAVLPK